MANQLVPWLVSVQHIMEAKMCTNKDNCGNKSIKYKEVLKRRVLGLSRSYLNHRYDSEINGCEVGEVLRLLEDNHQAIKSH